MGHLCPEHLIIYSVILYAKYSLKLDNKKAMEYADDALDLFLIQLDTAGRDIDIPKELPIINQLN